MHWFYRFLCCILRCGPLPLHFSVIMDGNRRYARSHGLPSLSGHVAGYASLLALLEWSRELGVRSVSAWAWSIDNFHRSAAEVSQLMRLMADKMTDLVQRAQGLHRHHVHINVLGNTSLLPPFVQQCMEDVRRELGADRRAKERRTHADTVEGDEEEGGQLDALGDGKVHINLCVAYTSQQEMTDAAAAIGRALQSYAREERARADCGDAHSSAASSASTASSSSTPSPPHSPASPASPPLSPSPSPPSPPSHLVPLSPFLHPLDLTPSLFASSLYSSALPPSLRCPSLLLRTSGEHRLSDFSLVQVRSAALVWVERLWPEVRFVDLVWVLLGWQRGEEGRRGREEEVGRREEREEEEREDWVREWVREGWRRGRRKEGGEDEDGLSEEEAVSEWMSRRGERVEAFLRVRPSYALV